MSVLRGENKREFVLDYAAQHANQPGIVYAATRKEVDNLYQRLPGRRHHRRALSCRNE